jgi:DNA ligase 1
MLGDYPAFVRLYDILFEGSEDLRALSWSERRSRLEALIAGLDPERFDYSETIEAPDFESLEKIREGARDSAIEGVMLKRRDSAYVAGRRVGLWYKWKRRSAYCRLRADVRCSRKRQKIFLLFRFHVRLLERGW